MNEAKMRNYRHIAGIYYLTICLLLLVDAKAGIPKCPIGFEDVTTKENAEVYCVRLKEAEPFTSNFIDCTDNLFTSKLFKNLNLSVNTTIWAEYKTLYPGGPFIDWSYTDSTGNILTTSFDVKYNAKNGIYEDLCTVIGPSGILTAVSCNDKHQRYCIIRPYDDSDDMSIDGCQGLKNYYRFWSPRASCLTYLKGRRGSNVRASWRQAKDLCTQQNGTLLQRGWRYANHPRLHVSKNPDEWLEPLGLVMASGDKMLWVSTEDGNNEVSNAEWNFSSEESFEDDMTLAALKGDTWMLVNSTFIFYEVICERTIHLRNVSLNLSQDSTTGDLILHTNDSYIDTNKIWCFTDSTLFFPSDVKVTRIEESNNFTLKPQSDGYFWCIHSDSKNFQVSESNKRLYIRDKAYVKNLYAIKVKYSQKYTLENLDKLLKEWTHTLSEYIYLMTQYKKIYKMLPKSNGVDNAVDILKTFKEQHTYLLNMNNDILYVSKFKRIYLDGQTVLLQAQVNPSMDLVPPGVWNNLTIVFMKPSYFCKAFDGVPSLELGQRTTKACITYSCVGDFNEGVNWLETTTDHCVKTTTPTPVSVTSSLVYHTSTSSPNLTQRFANKLRTLGDSSSEEDGTAGPDPEPLNTPPPNTPPPNTVPTNPPPPPPPLSTTETNSIPIETTLNIIPETTLNIIETTVNPTIETINPTIATINPTIETINPTIETINPTIETTTNINMEESTLDQNPWDTDSIPIVTLETATLNDHVLTTENINHPWPCLRPPCRPTTTTPLPTQDLLNNVMNNLEELLNNATAPVQLQDVATSFDEIDQILDVQDTEVEIPSRLLNLLETLGSRIELNDTATAITVRSNIALLLADASPQAPCRGMKLLARDDDAFTESAFEILADINNTHLYTNASEAVVHLPDSVTQSDRRISFVVFRNDRAFSASAGRSVYSVNSRVLSVNVGNVTTFRDGEVVDLHFRPIVTDTNATKACAYWQFLGDGETGFWSQEGCTFIQSTDQDTLDTCRCTHLTHFAQVLVPATTFSDGNEKALEIISLICLSLSLFGLLMIGLTAALFRSWRRDFNNKIWLQLCVSIFILIICFFVIVFANFETYNVTCMLVGVALHYSVLASFCWMLVSAIISYRRLVLVFTRDASHKLLRASAFAWGAPCAVVGILLSVDPRAYAGRFDETSLTNTFCYPSGLGLWLAVYMPLALMLLANWTLFALIVRSVFASRSIQRHGDSKEALRCATVSCLLVFLFGLPWIFGLFSWIIVFAYLFNMTSTLQGFVLFIFFVVGNKKTRDMWLNKLKIKQSRKVPVTSSTYKSTGAGWRGTSGKNVSIEANISKPRSMASSDDSRFS